MAADLDLTPASCRPWYLYDVPLPESAPAALTSALAGAGAGNLSNGDYLYKVGLVTAEGESIGEASTALTVADYTANGKAALSAIATGTADRTTARNIYRTVADGSDYYLLATISDNSTTTYTDNISDATLITQGAMPSTANTSGIFHVLLPRNTEVTIAHSGLTAAGGTSGATDALIVCNGNQTQAVNTDAGAKGIIWANGDTKTRSTQIRSAADGDHIIQISALTTGGKAQFVMSHPQ